MSLLRRMMMAKKPSGGQVSEIEFTIEGYRAGNPSKNYIAKEGMTWREWVNSDYDHAAPTSYSGDYRVYTTTSREYIMPTNTAKSQYYVRYDLDSPVYPDDIIEAYHTYMYYGEATGGPTG